MAQALGIDIGGTGIKGALVDTETGSLLTDRIKLATPEGGSPDDIVSTVVKLIADLGGVDEGVPLGVCFPAIVRNGRTMSAANVSKKWIGLEAEALFEKALGRDIHFVNDADAAGIAEVRYGAAKGVKGLVLLTTLGTGIGSALIYNDVLIPNSELGHLELNGHDAESKAAYSAKEREDLDWLHWAKRLQKYYTHLELLFSPDLFIVGGGVSKNFDDFGPLLDLQTKIVPATLRNNAGILGAAALASPAPGGSHGRPPYSLGSRADVVTERPERWAKQLASHISHKVPHQKTARGDELSIGEGLGIVSVSPGHVVLEAYANDAEMLARVEDVLGRHLERFAEKDGLKVTWSR